MPNANDVHVKLPAVNPENSCPCDSGARYGQCCEPLHLGQPAADAAALMRSRYCAFVLGDAAYLRRSWHPSKCPADLELDPDIRWLGLKIKAQRSTGDATAEVEFIARFRKGGGSAQRQLERSRFVRENGHWFYVDGDLQG